MDFTDTDLATAIIQNALDYAIFTMTPEGAITSWSPGAERILGMPANEALGAHVSTIYTEADRAADLDVLERAKALEDGRAEDSRWHLRRNGERFWANGVTMRIVQRRERSLIKIMRDETRTKLAEDQRTLLLNELNHRMKNTLVTIQSIVEQTLRVEPTSHHLRKTLTDRIIALSDAHNVLVQESWAGADLRTVVEQAVSLHQRGDEPVFKVDGPPARLSPHQAVAMALALHELATNALKYGALSRPEGHIDISWNIALDGEGRRYLTLLWCESGGPPVVEPTKTGFGTRLIARTFGAESGGRARLTFRPEGLQCVIDLPLSSAEESQKILAVGESSAAT